MSVQEKTTKSLNINLMPEEEFGQTPFGKFVKWLLSTGRYIVVFTELIVILAFISRFKLDRDLTDLHELIDQKKAIITSASSLENEIRNLQDGIEKIRQIENQQIPYNQFLTGFNQLVPKEITIDSFSLQGSVLSLACLSQTPEGIGLFIYQLKTSTMITGVSIDDIARKNYEPVEFNLTINLSKEAFKIKPNG